MITDEILMKFKRRMHLGDYEDENLKGILEKSANALIETCGEYDMSDGAFEELVFERSRYVYNDALEFFEDNFLSDINKLILKNAFEEFGDEDEAL